MSKEVKLGLAIGGILLSVIFVFMLAVSGDPVPQDQVTLELPPQPVDAAPSTPAPGPVTPDPVARPDERPALPVPETTPATLPDSAAVAEAQPQTKNDPWVDLLATGKFEQTSTPVPSQPVMLVPDIKPTVPAQVSEPARKIDSPPSDRPVSSVARTHQVQRGETFSSISAAAYGSAAYFAHIIRANPGIDPNKLRPGMIINLPPESQVKATSTPAANQTRSIDDRTEYRVQGNDNLYKISMKLYGKPDFMDKLYEANKATIGADKAKLHVGMILKLPEAPTAIR